MKRFRRGSRTPIQRLWHPWPWGAHWLVIWKSKQCQARRFWKLMKWVWEMSHFCIIGRLVFTSPPITMKTFIWNARGLGSNRAFNILRSHKQETKPELMFLIKTKCDHVKMEKWRVQLGYSSKLVVNSIGRSGGLCIFWDESIDVTLLTFSQEHIDVMIKEKDRQQWRFTGFYGHPDRNQKHHSWTRLAGMSCLPWVCMGDFNEVLSDDEKLGGSYKRWREMSDFREALEDANLEDMGFIGAKFTWSNKRDGASSVLERLDRGLCNKGFRLICPRFVIRHMEFWGSDHRPLVIECPDAANMYNQVKRGRRFFFEECWTEDTECKEIVDSNLYVKREALRKACNMDVPIPWKDIKVLESRLDEVLETEERYWKQRAKVHWLQQGDRNTRFFHSTASARRARNRIHGLIDEGGTWRDSKDDLEIIISQYFSGLFSSNHPT
ncbi:hypothetical protein Dsin_024300 [Dipteronia sinensis]|uniref:Endonuclease/exonuclease/phosphatase domain-containing protein n=1 Tax=Dipteronia sinensis TaxID=43782 RepID=A0AAE0DVR6_9ROSI|nr:hypothetical protein Dsin_024300 [Dipteronia sinensis]